MNTEELVTLFQWLVKPVEGVELKGAKSTYISCNGNMFGFIIKDEDEKAEAGLALRLSKSDRNAFLEKHPDCVVVQYDTVMKDYVRIPTEMLENKRKLRTFFKKVCENAFALKPKPTTKKKAAKKKTAKKKTEVKKKPSKKAKKKK